jgi:hypothetical protein
MARVRDELAAYLLRGQHRATLVLGNAVHLLNTKNPAANISAGSLGSIEIRYDGLNFIVTGFSGTVTVNNLPLKVGQSLPGACVITLGDASLGWNRRYITMDVSHPEVVL